MVLSHRLLFRFLAGRLSLGLPGRAEPADSCEERTPLTSAGRYDMRRLVWHVCALALVLVTTQTIPALAQADKVVLTSKAPFARVATALKRAIADQGMGLVCHANAQAGAAARGMTIPGNQVLMVFRNDFAVRLINAEPRAAYEAPIRIYIYENPDGAATLAYVRPSVLFRAYTHPEVTKVGAELDPIFDRIAAQAISAE